MSVAEKIGYITIVYLGYRLYQGVIYKLYKSFLSHRAPVDLCSMGKWAAVTGCSHGIGRAYIETLARIGMNVILISPDADSLRTMARELEAVYNVKTKVIKLDVFAGLEAYEAVEKELFDLEVGVLVNNLGMSYPRPEYFLDLPRNDKIYMSIVHCNVVVVTNMCRILLPQMVERGKGVVVNVASIAAVLPSPMLTVFAATKAYVLKFSKDLQLEYGRHGIIVQCLLPGTLTNHTADSPKPTWIVPTPERYVESAIRTIGVENVTTGYLQHTVLIGIGRLIYRVAPNFVGAWMIKIMENNRSNALRRYIG